MDEYAVVLALIEQFERDAYYWLWVLPALNNVYV